MTMSKPAVYYFIEMYNISQSVTHEKKIEHFNFLNIKNSQVDMHLILSIDLIITILCKIKEAQY